MVDQPNHEIHPGQQLLQPRKSRVSGALIIVASLVVIAAASGYLWLNYDRMIQAFSSAARPTAAPVVGDSEETVALKDFQSFQQHTTDSMQSTTQALAAQQENIKRLSDQISALSARIDAVQSASSSPQPAAPDRPAVPARRTVIRPHKKPAKPKPAGAISIGGAPLPTATAHDGR